MKKAFAELARFAPVFAGLAFFWPALLLFTSKSSAAESSRRFAIIVANNNGGPGTRQLRYAHQDATRIRDILIRLGNIKDQDTLLLLEKTATDLRNAIQGIEPRLQQAASNGYRPLLIIYFSGHAKDGALRLGDTSVTLEEVKQSMGRSAAEIRIGLFDSCRSGVITRAKGARRAPAFDVDTNALQTAKGLVMLTSSSANEDSQESDELSGSFFSHHLASGLLGSADTSGDGRVSLAEAYAYAYERTVADTADTAAGPQHPTFSYDLAGNGDVILTDFTSRNEGLILPANIPAGDYFLIDGKGTISAEISKIAGVEKRIALAPGLYKVKRRMETSLRIGQITIPQGKIVALDESRLKDAPFSDDPVKGAQQLFEQEMRFGTSLGLGFQHFLAGPFPSSPVLSLEASLRKSFAWTFDLGLSGGNSTIKLADTTLRYKFSEIALGVSMTKEVLKFGSFSPFVGARFGMLMLNRTFDDPGIPKQPYIAVTPGLVVGIRLELSRRWSVTGRARGHYFYYNVDYPKSLAFIESALIASFEF